MQKYHAEKKYRPMFLRVCMCGRGVSVLVEARGQPWELFLSFYTGSGRVSLFSTVYKRLDVLHASSNPPVSSLQLAIRSLALWIRAAMPGMVWVLGIQTHILISTQQTKPSHNPKVFSFGYAYSHFMPSWYRTWWRGGLLNWNSTKNIGCNFWDMISKKYSTSHLSCPLLFALPFYATNGSHLLCRKLSCEEFYTVKNTANFHVNSY